jgi:hypothetical protein
VRAGTFAAVAEELADSGEGFDAVLADLGVSSMQLDDESRGFSMRSIAPADMRMGDGCLDTALSLIDRLDEGGLADVIYRFGEERLSRRIARALKQARLAGTLESASELAAVVRAVVPGHTHRHPAARTFQALRIAINDELGELERLLAVLPSAAQGPGPGGGDQLPFARGPPGQERLPRGARPRHLRRVRAPRGGRRRGGAVSQSPCRFGQAALGGALVLGPAEEVRA